MKTNKSNLVNTSVILTYTGFGQMLFDADIPLLTEKQARAALTAAKGVQS